MKKKKAKPSITQLANAAFKDAAEKVVELAIRTGTPLILWENNAVARVDPHTWLERRKKKKAD